MKKKPIVVKLKEHKPTTNSAVVDSIVNQPPSKNDPNGSYTGKPIVKNEVPVQDADDL